MEARGQEPVEGVNSSVVSAPVINSPREGQIFRLDLTKISTASDPG